ncbi:hypothetical protein THAOC_14748, partial [Thalassiosira oceanica]
MGEFTPVRTETSSSPEGGTLITFRGRSAFDLTAAGAGGRRGGRLTRPGESGGRPVTGVIADTASAWAWLLLRAGR